MYTGIHTTQVPETGTEALISVHAVYIIWSDITQTAGSVMYVIVGGAPEIDAMIVGGLT